MVGPTGLNGGRLQGSELYQGVNSIGSTSVGRVSGFFAAILTAASAFAREWNSTFQKPCASKNSSLLAGCPRARSTERSSVSDSAGGPWAITRCASCGGHGGMLDADRMTVVPTGLAYRSPILARPERYCASSTSVRGTCGKHGKSQKTPRMCWPSGDLRNRRRAASVWPSGSGSVRVRHGNVSTPTLRAPYAKIAVAFSGARKMDGCLRSSDCRGAMCLSAPVRRASASSSRMVPLVSSMRRGSSRPTRKRFGLERCTPLRGEQCSRCMLFERTS